MRRSHVFLAALAILVAVAGCSAVRTVGRARLEAAPGGAPQRFSRFATPRGQPIEGYTTADGRYHEFAGTARLEGDSLVLHRKATQGSQVQAGRPELTARVATADVASVRATEVGVVQTAAGVAGFAFFLVAIGYAAAYGGFSAW